MSFAVGTKHRVLCSDGKYRNARVTGQPTTVWTVPASVTVSSKTVTGQVYMNMQEVWEFGGMQGRNAHLLPVWNKKYR